MGWEAWESGFSKATFALQITIYANGLYGTKKAAFRAANISKSGNGSHKY